MNPINAGAAIYIPKLSAITEIPSPKTSISEPSLANDIIEHVEIVDFLKSLMNSEGVNLCPFLSNFDRSILILGG